MSDDTRSEHDGDERLFALTRDNLLLAAILLVGVAGSGIVRRLLGELGYNDVGALVFMFGYGGMIFAIWYGWIRPMDISGPN
ncbi:hypothetical protein [Halobellus litoreus]|jgi:hypothetical protein|uniref:Uncharacterized protein n=1 Tax=Halobellus litoreus TaxID=755310 RepID=A0ABD6DTX1_9EURY|nr:hypothetical protein [Halobellus litoreus]